jgi:hypothetical protein
MVDTACTTRCLPVQHRRLDHRPLLQWLAADGQILPLGGRIQPVGTHDPRAGGRDVQPIAPDQLGTGSGHLTPPRPAGRLPIEAVPEGDLRMFTRHQSCGGERSPADIACSIDEDPGAMRIPRPDVHVPLLAPQLVEQVIKRRRRHPPPAAPASPAATPAG